MEDEENDTEQQDAKENTENDFPKKNGLIKKLSQNGIANGSNGMSVISKESLILVPDNTKTTNVNQSNGKESPIMQNNNDEVKALIASTCLMLITFYFVATK